MIPPYLALVRKSWLETRGRFLAGLSLVAVMVLYTVVRAPSTLAATHQTEGGASFGYGEYIWLSLHGGYLQAIWICAAVVLATGGLLREHTLGTAGFTLSLPVSRGAGFLIRSAVALVELALIGVLPALLLSTFSRAAGQVYPLEEALRFSVTLVGGGVVFFGWGLLLSHLLQGEYAVPMAGLVSAAVLFFVTKLPVFKTFNVFNVMSGAGLLDERYYVAGGAMPWMRLCVCVLLALLLAGAAGAAIRCRDL